MEEIINNKRQKIYERDNYRCLRCGGLLDLTLDHIVPRVKQGTGRMDNMQTLCKLCNSMKSDRIIDYRKRGERDKEIR